MLFSTAALNCDLGKLTLNLHKKKNVARNQFFEWETQEEAVNEIDRVTMLPTVFD